MKAGRGRLDLPLGTTEWLERTCAARGITVVPVSREIVLLASELPPHHRDPADRLILATALDGGLTLLSPDEALRSCKGERVRWA